MEDYIEYDELGQLSNHDELLSYLLGKEVDDNDLDNDKEDMFGPDEFDPAGGRGLSSHMEESKEQSLKERIAAMVREILSEEDTIEEGALDDQIASAEKIVSQKKKELADAEKKAADVKAKEASAEAAA